MARRAAARGSLAEQPALFPIDPTLPATGGALAPYTPAHDAGADDAGADDAGADDAGAVDRNGVPGFDPLGALPAGTMLLEASAGTGKTYTIASLVLRLVAGDGVAPLDVREILVVTFTQAAATELRERVRARLRDAHQAAVRAQGALAAPAPGAGAAEGGAAGAVAAALAQVAAARRDQVTRDVVTRAHEQGRLDEVAQRLGDALERFDDAPIGTIHGFCSRVLREHAFACGAELDAEPLEDVDALVDELAHDFWVREMADRSPAMVRALVERGKLGLATVRALVRRALAHQDAPCVPACPEASGDECDAVVAARGALARRVAEHWSPSATHDAFEQLDRARADGTLNLNSWRADAIERRVRAVTHWAAAAPATAPCPPDLLYFATGDLARTCKKGKAPPSHPVFDDVQALVDAEARLEAAAGAEALRVRHECVRWARAEAARRKRALRVHGYDDLLRLVRDALRRDCPARGGAGTLATALRASFGAALIDEFQDTDPAQWEIFHRAFGDAAHRLVLIGDPKQAIYRFRGADVDAVPRRARTRGGADVRARRQSPHRRRAGRRAARRVRAAPCAVRGGAHRVEPRAGAARARAAHRGRRAAHGALPAARWRVRAR
jgi:exodeoxyribonuclease V beta subunit